MKERPILYTGAMVRSILDGRKTQTRRLVKNHDYFGCLTGDCPHSTQSECDQAMAECCPYGMPGDRLWVKETHLNHALPGYPPVWFYRADGDEKPEDRTWRPSIFCPRSASRILLEITAVRVERLNDISEEDAKAEGCQSWMGDKWNAEHNIFDGYRRGYRELWESINGADSWVVNPWVWVIGFPPR